MSEHRLWSADPHRYGPGKIHIVDGKDDSKTLCGKFLAAMPGSQSKATHATCKICLDAVVRRPEQERRQEEYEKRRAEHEAQRTKENEQWQAWYQQYLKSSEWAERRRLVIQRAGGICEGCGRAPAIQAHHITYKHAGNEFLWELRAICRGCHERIHEVENAG